MTDQELHALEVELDEYGSISKADALRLIADNRRYRELFGALPPRGVRFEGAYPYYKIILDNSASEQSNVS